MKTYKEILETKSDKELVEILKKLDIDCMCERLGISDVRDICNEAAKRLQKYIKERR